MALWDHQQAIAGESLSGREQSARGRLDGLQQREGVDSNKEDPQHQQGQYSRDEKRGRSGARVILGRARIVGHRCFPRLLGPGRGGLNVHLTHHHQIVVEGDEAVEDAQPRQPQEVLDGGGGEQVRT